MPVVASSTAHLAALIEELAGESSGDLISELTEQHAATVGRSLTDAEQEAQALWLSAVRLILLTRENSPDREYQNEGVRE